MMMRKISTTIFQKITEKLKKNDILCFHNFGDIIAAQCIICHPQVRKGVIES